MKFLYRPVKKNVYSRHGNKILYLVIHDTGNTAAGANALNHKNYVGTNSRKASAHYFVDDHSIVQFVGDSKAAGAVGDGRGRYGITNQNSLNVEMCINSDGNYTMTYKNTVELTKNLMKKFNIPIDRVVRHYDASKKNCPGHMSKNNWRAWWQFKTDILKPMEWEIDLSKDSEFGGKKMTKDYEEHWAKESIEAVKKAGIMVGDSEGNFHPDRQVTRAELAIVVAKALNLKK